MSKMMVTALAVSFAMSQNVLLADYGSSYNQSSGYIQDQVQDQYDQTAPNYNQAQNSTNARNPAYYRQGQQGNSSYNNQNSGYNTIPATPSNVNPSTITAPQAYNDNDDQNNQISAADYSATVTTQANPQDSAATDADRQINARIREKITGWFKDRYKNVSLRTANGAVTLVGFVQNNDDVDAIVIEVRKIPGVRNVNNNLQISNASDSSASANTVSNSKFPQDRAATESDRQLNEKIRNKITGWFSDSFKNISLNTNNGNVTINGYVANQDDIEKLQKELRKIDGVRNVNANLQIANQSDSSDYNASANSVSNSKFPQDRAASESDRQLNEKIRNKITGWFSDSFKNISLNTSNGNVTINGYVANRDDIEKLQKELRKIDGVRSVNTNLQIANQSDSSDYNASTNTVSNSKFPQDRAASESDRQLNEKIRNKITGWFSDSFKNISLNTNNGIVTINGYVAKGDDIEKLQRELRKIEGVRSVNNNLQIANQSDSSDYNASANTVSNSKFPQDRAATESDRLLNEKIRNKITGWFSDSFKNITLNTNNGIVTINGYVANGDDIEKLQKELRKVEGVRAINANIQIRQQ